MKCPNCPDATLVMTERHKVEIVYCPQCRGIWLDRGELDKLIERSEVEAKEHFTSARPAVHQPRQVSHSDFSDSDYYSDRKRYGGRKKSWLGEIFD